MLTSPLHRWLLMILLTASPLPVAAAADDLVPAAIFSDHMVLQREAKVPVWGVAKTGDIVTITFNGQTKSAVAGTDGQWMVRFDEMPAKSEPGEMIVKNARTTLTFKDVVVGDVWLGSGQSNMEFAWTFSDEFKVRRAEKEKQPELAKAPKYMGKNVDEKTMQVLRKAVGNPMIRVSAKTRDHLTTPNTGWSRITEENFNTLPALAGCIAVYLHEEIQVPIGIIVRAVSSTHTARWITKQGWYENSVVIKQLEAAKAAGKTVALNGTSAKAGFGNLYKEYIDPVVPYALRGFLWDQGEQGIGFSAVDWTAAMHALVTSWRAAWGQGDLPWSATDHYPDDLEAKLRTEGLKAFKIARTDGLSGALHPLNKWQYAQKHVNNILPMAYGKESPFKDAVGKPK